MEFGTVWSGVFYSCKGQECKSWLTEACETFPSLEREGDHPTPGGWWKVECCMWIHGICCSSLFYKRGYSQNPPPVPLQEAHRPAILKLRHRPTSVQDVPTCEPLARTDHEPKAHLCMLECRKPCGCAPSEVWFAGLSDVSSEVCLQFRSILQPAFSESTTRKSRKEFCYSAFWC